MSQATETGNMFEWGNDGKLQPYSLPEQDDRRDDEESDDKWLERLGYKWEGNSGVPDVHQLRWFRRVEDEDEHPFVAILDEVDFWRVIFLPSFDALLRLRAMIAPMLSQGMLEAHLTQLDDIATKAFRVWHRHDPYGACEACDPDEMERRRVNQAKKAAAAKP